MTTRSLFKFALVASLAIVAPFSAATMQCRIKGGCIDEASASLVGLIEVYKKKCSETDPARAGQYREGARRSLSTGDSNEDADFLRRLYESAVYTRVFPQLKSQVDNLDRKQLLEHCRKFFPDSSKQETTVQ